MSSSKDKSLNTLMWQLLSFAQTDRSTSGADFVFCFVFFFAYFWVLLVIHIQKTQAYLLAIFVIMDKIVFAVKEKQTNFKKKVAWCERLGYKGSFYVWKRNKKSSWDVTSVSLYNLLIVNANSSFHDLPIYSLSRTFHLMSTKVFRRLMLALTRLSCSSPVINESFIAVLESKLLNQSLQCCFIHLKLH